MPYQRVRIDFEEAGEAPNPEAKFRKRSIFGKRVSRNSDEKGAVGFYIAETFAEDGTTFFVSDGSSTFYVLLALAQKYTDMEFSNHARVITNNLAITTELAAHPFTPDPKLNFEILGGDFSHVLDATFPEVSDKNNWDKVDSATLSIVSVRELFYKIGPTSPERESNVFKKRIFESGADLIIPVTWNKLSRPVQKGGTNVFNAKTWLSAMKIDRKITIVCPEPIFDLGSDYETSCQRGEELFGSGLSPKSANKWKAASDHDRYCWTVYSFANHENIEFVELILNYLP